jgi:hypothetical protein
LRATLARRSAGDIEDSMPEITRDAGGMVANMDPALQSDEFVFCAIDDESVDWRALKPLGQFREAESTTLILERTVAEQAGFDVDLPMRQITLRVHSALDGVGLTAAVASALSDPGIPCNMVAAFHHDHVFVPSSMAAAALDALRKVQASAT